MDHEPEANRWLCATAGRHRVGLQAFAQDMRAHGGDQLAIEYACIDMRAAYAKGIGNSRPDAHITYDNFHAVALANRAVDKVRREEMRSSTADVRNSVDAQCKKALRQLRWGMRKDLVGWTHTLFGSMYWPQRSNLKSARV